MAETQVSFTPRHFSHSAGLTILYDNENFAYLRLYSSESLRSTALGIVLVRGGTKHELLTDRVAVDTAEVVLHVRVREGTLQFGWRMPNEAAFHDIGPEIDATYMSDEAIRGFTGTMIGMACVRLIPAERACTFRLLRSAEWLTSRLSTGRCRPGR